MAGKQQKNMFGGFGAAAQQRKEQQEQIEAAVTGKPVSGVPSVGREKKRGEDATTITLAISREDVRYAARLDSADVRRRGGLILGRRFVLIAD